MNAAAVGRKTIVGNALSLTAGSAASQALMALSTLLVARQLGPTAFGTYAGSFSAAALLGIGFNLGLDTWLLRAGAAHRDQLGGLLRSALLIKLAAGVPWALGVVLLLPALNAETFRPSVVLVAALAVWAEGLFGLGLAVFRTLLRNGTTAALMLASRGGIFALTAALVLTGERAVLPYALIRLVVGAVVLLVTWRLLPVRPAPVAGIAPAATARASLPFALSDLFMSVYVQADVTIAAIALGSEAVGLYAPASSLIAALFVVPTALFYVAVPVLTAALNDPARLRRLLRSTLAVFAATGVAMWVLTWLAVDLVPLVLGPSYARSAALLRILSPILLLKGFSFGAAAILVAVGRQTRRMAVQAAAAALNVALNLAVVSVFGITGVAVVYVVSELFLAGGYLAMVLVVGRQSSVVRGQSSVVRGQSSEGRGQSSAGSGQQSSVVGRRSSSTRITVINLHSSRNVGDAALLEMALATLRGAFPGCHVTLAMNDPDRSYAEGDPAAVAVIPSLAAVMAGPGARRGPLRQIIALVGILAVGLPAAMWCRGGRFRAFRRSDAQAPEPAEASKPAAMRLSGHLPRRGSLSPHRELSVSAQELRDLLRGYTDADLIVGCPGNIFASTGRVGKTLVIAALTVAYALLLGKPFYVLPQSIGPLRGGWPRRVTGALYRRARLVFAREPLSFRVGQALGLKPERLRLAPDLAFALPPAPREEAQAILRRLGLGEGPCLGVTVINRLLRTVDDDTWDRYEAAMAHALSRFMAENRASVVFLPQVTGPTAREDDREAARRVVAAMGNPPAAVVLDDILPPAVLKALCGEMDAFVATRMHSAIFALGMGVPTLMIEYLAKTRGLAEMLGLESWRLDLTEVEPDRLVDALDRLWRERDAYRQRLAETIPPLAQAASDVGRLIAQDFYGR